VLAAASSVSVDSISPTVSIVSPIGGATVSGSLPIQGSATDNIGVTRVELWIDNLLDSACSNTAYSCSWNSASASVGSHLITVKAYDAAGNMGSVSETLVVAAPAGSDTQKPTVQIANPAAGTAVTGTINITAIASDNVGIAQLCIYVDDVLKSSSTGSSATYSWNTKKGGGGSHTITAKAWDAAGNYSAVTISVTAR